MADTYDQSHLDKKYFIDSNKYNCPYCNRRSVTYRIVDTFDFDWSNQRKVYGYIVRCGSDSCGKESLHLSNHNFETYNNTFWSVLLRDQEDQAQRINIDNLPDELPLDSLLFYHQPTTFFTLDSRINENIRTLIAEAEGCAKMNYLVGASGCLRKAIYELLDLEQIPEKDEENKPINYEARIKQLKTKYSAIPQEYFDALSNIQNMTSKRLHEGKWEAWTQNEFKFLVEVTKEILTEMYVKPKEKASVLQKILGLDPQSTDTPEEVEEENPEKTIQNRTQ